MSTGMAFAPWNMLRSGRLRTDAEEAEREGKGQAGRKGFNADWKRNDAEKHMSGVLEKIAKEIGTENIRAGPSTNALFSTCIQPDLVLIAYHLQKLPYVFPLVGGNKSHQLEQNIDALKLSLTDSQINEIESASPFDVGFPHKYIVSASRASTRCRLALIHRGA